MEEATEGDKTLFADNKKRGTSLVLNDAILLLLHVVQVFAVIQSLALRWPFPEKWVKGISFVFLFNLDVWEFAKVQQNGTFKEVQGYFTPSKNVPISYWYILLVWAVFILSAVIAFVVAYIMITYKKHPFMMVRVAHLQRVYVILAQVICLPLGTVIARLFHCTDTGLMDVLNEVKCFSDSFHWTYIVASLAVVVAFYVLLPTWMIVRTRAEMLDMTTDRHEGYLQLKETEYVLKLDILYIVGGFHMFASFKKHGTHFRALLIIFCLCILCVVAATFTYIFIGTLVINSILLLLFISFLFMRPFRVTAFNVVLLFSYFCLVLNCLLGSLRTTFSSVSLASVWLTPTYMNTVLLIINVTWLCGAVTFVVYLSIRHTRCCSKRCLYPLWPSLTSEGLNKLSPETRKYVRAIIRSRTLIGKLTNEASGSEMFGIVSQCKTTTCAMYSCLYVTENVIHIKAPYHLHWGIVK